MHVSFMEKVLQDDTTRFIKVQHLKEKLVTTEHYYWERLRLRSHWLFDNKNKRNLTLILSALSTAKDVETGKIAETGI